MAESFSPWGGNPGPSNRNSRTLPSWMDPNGLRGEVQFLTLKASDNHKLPQNPFIVAKSIDQAAGRIDGANSTDGGKSMLLKIRSKQQIDKLLQLRKLIDGTPIIVEMHPTKNTCQCVVSCREVAELTEDEICQALQDQNVVKVHRFSRKVDNKTITTNTMVLTLSGTVPPTHIWFGYLRVATRPYYPRPMQCFQCGKFGHTKLKCPNDPICPNCGEATIHPECPKPSHCNSCQGNHPTTNRSCPIYQQEQGIVRIRVDLGISHPEATKEYQSRLNAVAHSKVQQRIDIAKTTSNETNNKIQALEKQVADLIQKNLELTSRLLEIENEKNNSCYESDCTLTESNSESSMDTNDSSPSLNSTPKRGRGTESPGTNSPVKKSKNRSPNPQPETSRSVSPPTPLPNKR